MPLKFQDIRILSLAVPCTIKEPQPACIVLEGTDHLPALQALANIVSYCFGLFLQVPAEIFCLSLSQTFFFWVGFAAKQNTKRTVTSVFEVELRRGLEPCLWCMDLGLISGLFGLGGRRVGRDLGSGMVRCMGCCNAIVLLVGFKGS